MGELSGKVALVTGAGQGMGRAVALALGREGAAIAGVDLAPDALERTVGEITGAGGTARAFPADVAKKMQIQSMIEAVREAYGQIDILVNGAEVEPHGSVLTFDEWDWDRTLAVNLKGPFLLTQSVGRVMAEEGGGLIVNLGSFADWLGGTADRSAYMSSKMGLLGFNRAAARELQEYGIRVNAVYAGVKDLETTSGTEERTVAAAQLEPLPRKEDVVQAVLFLSSERALDITGQAFDVDGGDAPH